MTTITAVLLALAVLAATATAALAEDPHRGNSGHFSTASCPVDGNPNCPPVGK